MRLIAILAIVFAAFSVASSPARAQSKEAWCMALAQNYNTCVSRGQRRGGYGGGYDGGYDDDGYGRGYGRGYGHGGYGGYGGGYGYDRPRRRGGDSCAQILMQLKGMGCW